MIEVENLWKQYGSLLPGGRHTALCGVDLKVTEGSALALIGANGAGKSTLLRTIVNIVQPTRGQARVMGVDSRRIGPRELSRIGYIAESQEMPRQLTVGEYIDYLRPFYADWDRDLETSVREQLRLPADRSISALSHGMRMKMRLACALPYRPKLLILDEPFSGLDPLARDDLMETLLGQAGETTVLISTHELGEIEGLASHVAYLDQGRLLFSQTLTDLTDRFREVRISLDGEAKNPPAAPDSWLDIRAAGATVTFVDAGFSEDGLRAQVSALMNGVRRVETEPMGLRAIFTSLARAAQAKTNPETRTL